MNFIGIALQLQEKGRDPEMNHAGGIVVGCNAATGVLDLTTGKIRTGGSSVRVQDAVAIPTSRGKHRKRC